MSTNTFKCDLCGKEFKSKLGLAGHKGRIHSQSLQPMNDSNARSGDTPESATLNQEVVHTKPVTQIEFTPVEQETIPLEGVPGTSGQGPTQPTPDQQVQTASSGFNVLLKSFANRWNDSLEPGAQEPGPGQFKITDKEIEDLDLAIQGVLAKHGGSEGMAKVLLQYSAEIALAIVAASIVGKIIGGTMAKQRKFSPQEQKERKPIFQNPFKGIENPFKSPVNDQGISEKDLKDAAELSKAYWGNMPQAPITPGTPIK